MNASTSAIIKEIHQNSHCIYCGTEFKDDWEREISHGLERKVNKCPSCKRKARIKVNKNLDIDQFAKIHALDWGKEVKIKDF